MIPEWAWNLPINLINKVAAEHKIDRHLLAAICQQESNGQTYATRYERAYRYLLNPGFYAQSLGISQETEALHQATSWGLCQLMGSVLRELGWKDHLPKVTQPEVNLAFGAKNLLKLMNRHPAMKDVIAAYNAGSPRKRVDGTYENQHYVDKVSGYYEALTK